ncbi:MAG: AI-2E family transporter [Endozoicomonas sp.]
MNPADSIKPAHYLFTLAALVIILAGIKLASGLLTPMFLALFIALILSPVVHCLTRLNVPRGLAIFLVVTVVVISLLSVIPMAGNSLRELTSALPGYREQLIEMFGVLQGLLAKRGIPLELDTLLGSIDSNSVVGFVTSAVAHMGSATSYVVLMILTVVFMLLEAPLLHDKLERALPAPDQQLNDIERFISSVNRYLALKTVISILTGLLVALLLWSKGINFFILAGLTAFFLNFIPNIGSILSAIPWVLVTLLQLGIGDAVSVALGYLVINMVIGNFIEPKVLGRGLGLSSLTVFLSLIIWGWLLGPVGMLLSVPLTMCIKIFLESSARGKGLAILLGPGIEADKAESR